MIWRAVVDKRCICRCTLHFENAQLSGYTIPTKCHKYCASAEVNVCKVQSESANAHVHYTCTTLQTVQVQMCKRQSPSAKCKNTFCPQRRAICTCTLALEPFERSASAMCMCICTFTLHFAHS